MNTGESSGGWSTSGFVASHIPPTRLKVKLTYYANSIEAEGESEDVRKILASFLTLINNGSKENPF